MVKFDKNSISFKLWLYFVAFAVFLLGLLWCLQIIFLKAYYQEMKITETKRAAQTIKESYGSDDFLDIVKALSENNDMYIQIETDDVVIFTPGDESARTPRFMYLPEMGKVREALISGKEDSASMMISDDEAEGIKPPEMLFDELESQEESDAPEKSSNKPFRKPEEKKGNSGRQTLAYAAYLNKGGEDQAILYIFAPLFPVDSTVGILANQLIYVTVISLGLAFLLSFYLSRYIAKPIKKVNASARQLASGNLEVDFEGGHYTEISQLADTLNTASGELKKTEALRKDLIANVSHDLRTPLTMVKSYAEMIRDLSGDVPEKRNAHLQVIIEEADRLNVLVNDMLSLSQLQTGIAPLELSNFDLSESVQGVINTFAIYEAQGYSFRFEALEAAMVRADEFKIKRVVSNLLNNAVKYCGEDKVIRIDITKNDRWIRCSISDNGMGISGEELPYVWDRYYKTSTNHVRATKGTGLGLSIVKGIVELHRGRYGVESREGSGSTFWFELEALT